MTGPSEYPEEDWLALSGLQHFAFCRRQWALIHMGVVPFCWTSLFL